MQTIITRNKNARLHLAAANADAALALDTPPTGFDLIEAIVFGGYEPSPEQFREALATARLLRRTIDAGCKLYETPLITLDDRLWFVASRDDLRPIARGICRAAGHRTLSPACGVRMPS